LAHLLCNNLYFAATQHHALAVPARVEARLWHGHAIESEDTSSLRITTSDGVEVLSHLTLCPEREITPVSVIDAEHATITLRDFHTVEIEWLDGRTEVRESERENRLDMIEALCRQLRNSGEHPLCPLRLTRPFTRTVNLAFEQVLAAHGGSIPGVPPESVERYAHDGSIGTRITGINDALQSAHESGELLEFSRLPTATAG
jgi:hypothetical protein